MTGVNAPSTLAGAGVVTSLLLGPLDGVLAPVLTPEAGLEPNGGGLYSPHSITVRSAVVGAFTIGLKTLFGDNCRTRRADPSGPAGTVLIGDLQAVSAFSKLPCLLLMFSFC